MTLSAKPVNFIGENPKSKLVALSDEDHPLFSVTYGGDDKWRPAEQIDAFEFIGEKGIKAKGKQLAKWQVGKIKELEPLIPSVRNVQPDDDSDAEIAPEPDDQSDSDDQPTLF